MTQSASWHGGKTMDIGGTMVDRHDNANRHGNANGNFDSDFDNDDFDSVASYDADATKTAGRGDAPRGWRHGAAWTYLVMLAASAVALMVSFVLSAETLHLARNPDVKLDCDVNSVVSCSTVAQSWQAEIIHIGDLSYPNAFFGIAAEAVFITVAVIGLARVRVPRWFAACTWLGGLAALAYAYWLFTQSVFVIHALCPWCLVLMFATTIQFMALTHASVQVQGLPRHDGRFGGLRRGLDTYYRLNIDLMIDVVWVLALVTVIMLNEGASLL